MRLTRCGAQVAENDAAIREAVADMLHHCDVVAPPTPLDEVLRYRGLTAEERDAITPTHLMPQSVRRQFRRLTSRVRGLLDLRSRHMVIHNELHRHRRVFIKYHEVGHDVLDWHRELFVVTSELDLRPDVRRVFEAEANHFAALTIFQADDMEKWQRGRRLRVEQLAALAARYEASLTATARQYVAVQDLPVALLAGYPESASDGRRGIRFRYGLANDAFLREFSAKLLGDELSREAQSCAVLNEPLTDIAREEFTVADLNGERRSLTAETLFNSYATLTLVHVEPRRSRVFALLPFPSRRLRVATRS